MKKSSHLVAKVFFVIFLSHLLLHQWRHRMNQLPAIAEVGQDLKLSKEKKAYMSGLDKHQRSEGHTMNLNQDVVLCLCQLHHSQKSSPGLGQILGHLDANIYF